MTIEDLKDAIKRNEIDTVITLAKNIEDDDLEVAIEEYEKYYNHEVAVSNEIQNIISMMRIRRVKNKIPSTGTYTYKLG